MNTWENIERKALWSLEHAHDLAPRETVAGMMPLLRIWDYRPLESYTSWTILSSGETGALDRPMVREVVWSRRQDEEHQALVNRKDKLRTKSQSTIRVRDARLSTEDLRPFMDAAGRRFVPSIPPEHSASQGNSCGIEGYRSLAYLRMEWRGSGPPEWDETIRWVTSLRDLLIASLKEREKV